MKNTLITPKSTPYPLPNINKSSISTLQNIALISQWTQQFEDIQEQILAQLPPHAREEELITLWEKYVEPLQQELEINSSVNPDILLHFQEESTNKLTELLYAYRKNIALEEISQARKTWKSQLEKSRQLGTLEQMNHWVELGCGIFFPESERSQQEKINTQYKTLRSLQSQLRTHPAELLATLQNPTTKNIPLSETHKSYLCNKARTILSAQQESFAKSLIENDSQGTPLQRDILEKAAQKNLIKPEYLATYNLRFIPERPLKNIDSLATSLLNTVTELINTYNTAQDVRGERRRSLLSLIASLDILPTQRQELVTLLNEQQENPTLAILRQWGQSYINSLYQRDGFNYLSPNAESWKAHDWAQAERCKYKAQEALQELLTSGPLPSLTAFKQQLPMSIYQATQKYRRPVFNDIFSQEYPYHQQSIEKTVFQEEETDATPSPHDWEGYLDRQLKINKPVSVAELHQYINQLYQNWITELSS